MQLKIASRESLTDKAYKQLEEMIVTLQLKPGSVLAEAELGERLQIGRTPIREALHRLAREGLVTILPRKGILVTEINPGKQFLVLEVRRELERLMARTSAARSTESERKAFRRIARGMQQAAGKNDDLKFMRHDSELNLLIAQASHNEYAAMAIQSIQGLSRRFWYVHYKQAADMPLCARLHAELAQKIADGDAGGAARASDRLVDYVEDFTRLAFSPAIAA
ncbi:MAG: GntR family transcriptional regulator [Betaproteobacteria bacterium SG8_40]|jgi:DNA-binding GntR family transcriptional regulator|nr:MAG: GntR family transcriptional regulator [Betaproteobacteria bacterium SG8_40]